MLVKTNGQAVTLSQSKIDALEAAQDDTGRITPASVVDAARAEDHPFHSYFEWRDEVAGEKYREMQARTLIRSVKVLMEVEQVQIQAPFYLRDPEAEPKEQGYVPTFKVKSEEEVKQDAMEAEVSRARSSLKRASSIASALEVEEDAGRINRAITALE